MSCWIRDGRFFDAARHGSRENPFPESGCGNVASTNGGRRRLPWLVLFIYDVYPFTLHYLLIIIGQNTIMEFLIEFAERGIFLKSPRQIFERNFCDGKRVYKMRRG